MIDDKEYIDVLTTALAARKDWLEMTELPNLKENLRIYQSSFASLYSIYLKKKVINEDPYKQEVKIGELEVPDTSAFTETKRMEQISIRLSDFDNQLDFLVNFYQFGLEFLNLERIKRILGLIRYINWAQLVPESQNVNTKAVAEITNQSKAGLDQIALSVVSESLTKLPKATNAVISILKNLTAYYKETYKLSVRSRITQDMSAAEATTANIKKKIAATMHGTPIYPDIIEEIVKEDYSPDGPALRASIIESLKIAAAKPKVIKKKVSYKNLLIDGMRAIGGAGSSLGEIIPKINENENTMANTRKTFWEKLRLTFRQMFKAEQEERIIDLEYMDPIKSVPVKQQLNYNEFIADLEKKNRILSGLGYQGAAAARLEAMAEDQLAALLEKTIRDVQVMHRTLAALDEYYKACAPKDVRDKIKGIKPELAAVKNSFVKANQLRHEYTAYKEEEEQMKRLGISTTP